METSHRTGLAPHLRAAARLSAVAAVVAACSTASSPSPEPVAVTSSAVTVPIAGLFPTGVDANGTPLANGAVDPHYVLTSSDATFPGPSADAVAASQVAANAWAANAANSKWISIQPSTQGATGATYTYTATFSLAGVDPTTATLSGTWAADDTVSLTLNGTPLAAHYAAPAWNTLAAFTIPAGSPFRLGTNTLAFVTVNSGGNVTGLQVATITGSTNGCTLDSQCTAAQFCDTQTSVCLGKLANGVAIPTITGHAPPLTGTCSSSVGTSVCSSGVCDVRDSDCGYANGDGPCTSGTTGNGGTVCRSGVCSASGVCVSVGGCAADADCTGGDWCNESTSTCRPPLANGQPVPSDPAHANPTLNGTCTAGAGALVCVSGVCDTKDNECGYASGDGPCTSGNAGNGGRVCRSGICSVSGTCEPAGSCAGDGDCTGGDWCDESSATCTPPLANGQPIPTDAPHTSPTLNGMCTAGAGALVCVSRVCDAKNNECGYTNGKGPCSAADAGAADAGGAGVCQSGVCDKDGNCGYANGDGPCTSSNEGTVCRSGTCSTSGVCEPAGGCESDADCAGGKWCNETMSTCTAKLANGQPIPTDVPHTDPTLNGMCTVAAASVVCTSGICDTKNNECGYADGDGPCNAGTAGTVCQSSACSVNGTCEPMGGCNIDADCVDPTPACNQKTHTCQGIADAGAEAGSTDAGLLEAGPVEAGGVDGARPEAGTDSGAAKDSGGGSDAAGADAALEAAPEDDASSDSAYLEGGGLSCGISARGASGTSGAGAAVVLALVALGRRRRARPM